MMLGFRPSSPDTNPQYVIWLALFLTCPFLKDRLEAMLVGPDQKAKLIEKKFECLSILASSLARNGMTTLEDREATPLSLVSGIPKVPFNGWYLPPSMVGPLVLAKEYLSLRRVRPSLPVIRDVTRTQLERYLS